MRAGHLCYPISGALLSKEILRCKQSIAIYAFAVLRHAIPTRPWPTSSSLYRGFAVILDRLYRSPATTTENNFS